MTTLSPASPPPHPAMSWTDTISDVDLYSGSDMDTSSVVSFDSFGDVSLSSATDIQDHSSVSSGASVFSISSSVRAQSFKHEYGRGLNNYSEVYQLPADGEELDRLGWSTPVLIQHPEPLNILSDRQHIIFSETMGQYPPPMEQVLAEPPPGEPPVACLDLGCGSGCWYALIGNQTLLTALTRTRIMDVARDFPHCSCVAVDLIPMQVV